jgi:hypothetical protein
MVTNPLAYPLHWPVGLPRATARSGSPFGVSLSRAVAELQDSLGLFGADTGMPVQDVVISSNVTLGAARPSDPGVAVYFEWDGARRCIAVDRFARPEDNVRAIYTILEARRQEMRCGGLHIVRAAFQGFSALPPPRDWRDVLGVGPDADLAAVEAAWREKARAAHPDRADGCNVLMAELNAAREAARREMAS